MVKTISRHELFCPRTALVDPNFSDSSLNTSECRVLKKNLEN